MQEFFQKSRVKVQDLLDDILAYTQSVYKQSSNLYSPASPWGQIMNVLAKIANLILFYIEDSITELNIYTAIRENSIRGMAALAGHNPTRAMAATGDIFLIPTGKIPNMVGKSVIIPNFTRFKCKNNGLLYTSILGQDELKINLTGEIKKTYIRLLQGDIHNAQFTGTGNMLQTYEVNNNKSTYIDQFFINVFVNSEKWTKYESIYDIPKGDKGYIVKTGITSGIDIAFGTNNFGTPPPLGSTILVEYLVTNGKAGNVNENTDILFDFMDPGFDQDGNDIDLKDVFTIGVATPLNFGVDPETISLTRALTPHTSRSFVLANTRNYIDFFKKFQMFSYIDVYTTFELYDPVKDYILYALLVPDITKRFRSGEDYFSLPLKLFMLTPLEKYKLQLLLEESGQKILGSIVEFVDPVFKRYVTNIYLNTFKGYSKDTIKTKITSALNKYFVDFKRTDYLPKSDLIALIEAIDGVDSVNLDFVSEDIEYELGLLMNPDTMFSSTALDQAEGYNSAYEIYDEFVRLAPGGDPNNLTVEDKTRIIFANPAFRSFMETHIDSNGDIVLSKVQVPLIRGGWYDRYGKFFADGIISDKPSSVNIYIMKENKKDPTLQTVKP